MVTKAQRDQSIDLAEYLSSAFADRPWREVQDRIVQELEKAEQRGAQLASEVPACGECRSRERGYRRLVPLGSDWVACPNEWHKDSNAAGAGSVNVSGTSGVAPAVENTGQLTEHGVSAETYRAQGIALTRLIAERESARRDFEELNNVAADLVAEAVGPYDPPRRGSNLEKLYRLVQRPIGWKQGAADE